MKRTQSLSFLFPPKSKTPALADSFERERPLALPDGFCTLTVQDKVVGDRPSPSLVTDVASLYSTKPVIDVGRFHEQFETILKDMIRASIYRAEVAKVMAQVTLGAIPADIELPLLQMDFSNLIHTLYKKIEAHKAITSPDHELQKKIDFISFISRLESKKLWIQLLSKDFPYRSEMYINLLLPEQVKAPSSLSKNKFTTFFYLLTQDSEESRTIYREMLLSEDARLKKIIDYLKKPEELHHEIMELSSRLDQQKLKITKELFGLFHVLLREDEIQAKRLAQLNVELLALMESYPKGLVFNESWLHVSRQLFDNINLLLQSTKLIDILAIEAKVRLRPSFVTIKPKEEGEDFDYFVDFDSTVSRDEHYMMVENEIGSGYFHGRYKDLAALNYVLSSIYEKYRSCWVYAMQ